MNSGQVEVDARKIRRNTRDDGRVNIRETRTMERRLSPSVREYHGAIQRTTLPERGRAMGSSSSAEATRLRSHTVSWWE